MRWCLGAVKYHSLLLGAGWRECSTEGWVCLLPRPPVNTPAVSCLHTDSCAPPDGRRQAQRAGRRPANASRDKNHAHSLRHLSENWLRFRPTVLFVFDGALSSTEGHHRAPWRQLHISQMLQPADGGTGLRELWEVSERHHRLNLPPEPTHADARLDIIKGLQLGGLICQRRRRWQVVFTFLFADTLQLKSFVSVRERKSGFVCKDTKDVTLENKPSQTRTCWASAPSDKYPDREFNNTGFLGDQQRSYLWPRPAISKSNTLQPQLHHEHMILPATCSHMFEAQVLNSKLCNA